MKGKISYLSFADYLRVSNLSVSGYAPVPVSVTHVENDGNDLGSAVSAVEDKMKMRSGELNAPIVCNPPTVFSRSGGGVGIVLTGTALVAE